MMDICDELEAKASTVHGGAYAVMHKARKEIAALRVALDQAQKDAERYRKWRADYTGGRTTDMLLEIADAWEPADLDAVIDAAMKEAP
jgi:hypothetical protein